MVDDLRERAITELSDNPHLQARAADRRGVPAASLAELSGLLWRERDVLDRLLVALETGVEDVERAGLMHSISSLEVHRAITAREVAVELGFDGEPSLSDLIERTTGEWAAVLAGHRQVLRSLSSQLRDLPRPAVVHQGANVVVLPVGEPAPGRTLQRSLRDFLV